MRRQTIDVPVSVVIPLYEKARHISRAVDSVLAQTHSRFELIVVDDGSTDGGGALVGAVSDPRVRLISQENRGECEARNRGVAESRHDLVAFLDADDEWKPEFLETVLHLRERFPQAGLFATACLRVGGGRGVRPPAPYAHCPQDPRGGLIEDYFEASLMRLPVPTPSTAMVPRAVLQEVGGFPPGMAIGGDLHVWGQIALRYEVAWSPVIGAIYNLSADNRACNRRFVVGDVGAALGIEKFLMSGRQPRTPRRMVEEHAAMLRLGMVLPFHLQGDTAWARALLRKTRGTTTFKKRRLFLQCVTCFPPRVVRSAMAVKAAVRRLRTRISPPRRQ